MKEKEKKEEKNKPEKAKKQAKEKEEEIGRGILPDRNFKKNMGCGG